MKINRFVILCVLSVFMITTQAQNFNHAILINSTYSQNSTVSPFNGSTVTGIGISGSITFNSDTSFVRIIADDNQGNVYLVYETYPMLTTNNSFNFTQQCEESCYFDTYSPENLIIQIRDANLTITTLSWSDIVFSNVPALKALAKSIRNSEKLSAVREYIDQNNLIWVAEETELSKLPYSDKAKLWGSDYASFGLEFYSKGYYSMFGPDRSQTMSYGYADNFDWRNRHRANVAGTPYYDGDEDGTGWMTPAVCQGLGCWYNNEFICNTTPGECDAMGGIYRTAPTCWAFGPTAQIEALTNLYYNEHVDVDLSEQYIVCEEGVITHGWYVTSALNHYKSEGVPDEACLPYSASLENCSDLCNNPQEKINIDGYQYYSSSLINHEDVRQFLMETGPVTGTFMNMPWGTQSHAMVLVGWGVIDEDALGIVGVENPVDNDWYGHTYWIYKQSDGPGAHHNGFYYMIHWDGMEPSIYTVDPHITSLNRTDADVNCYDKDGDGYYFWGIGPKPAYCPPCPDRPDGDDSDPGLGPINEFGSCTIINAYTASFEKNWNNWVQVDSDDQDWWRHTGPTETADTGPSSAQDGDYYIYTEASCEGCYPHKDFIIESPPIDLSSFCEAQVDFNYHQHTYLWGNPDATKLELQISQDGGQTWSNNYWYITDNQGDEWHNVAVRFPSTTNKIRFVVKTGDFTWSDVALDNITIGPSVKDETPILISTNSTWSTSRTIKSDVIVENGAELTISNCMISMHEQTKIIVKQGGVLTINNATIQCQCDYATWQGIQVWGNKTESQQPLQGESCAQGKLILKNSATIENAIVGVDLWNPDQWNTTGGMVFADGAIFRNNAKSVHALHYRNFNPYYPEVEWDYMSNFKNCTFEITSDYPGDVTFYKHVDLSHVKGIDFQGCDFRLATEVEGVSQWNIGIAAYDAKFNASAFCTATYYPCPEEEYKKNTFTGFYSGVFATSDYSTANNFQINRAEFNNNTYGVKVYGVNNASILFSDFKVGGNKSSDKLTCVNAEGFGIYMDNASGFAIEENHFTKYPGATSGEYFGIAINNTESSDEIYKNFFDGVSYANYSEGKNWVPNYFYRGLSYFCNENSNNYADFYVSSGPYSGIQTNQGDENHAAGNTFSQNGATWHFFNDGATGIDYYSCITCPGETPDNDKIYGVNKKVATVSNTCPSHYGGAAQKSISLTDQQKQDAEQDYLSNLNNFNSVKALYESNVDGGDTESELSDIESAQPDDMWTLRTQLLGDSPHLSLEVLKKVADKTDVFSESALFDILAANPDELKKEELIQYLEDKENPLPEYMIEILKQLTSGTTYKTILQQQMAWYNSNYTRSAHELIRSYLSDTVTDYNSLRNWLDNLGGIQSDRQIIATYVQEGNFTDAFALANMLPQLYELKGDDLTEHKYYLEMLKMYQTLDQKGINTNQLDEEDLNSLEIMAENSKSVAGIQSKSILESVYGYHFIFCPETDGTPSYKSGQVSVESLGKSYGIQISVKPNPASQWAAFDYVLPEGETNAVITLTDVTGKTITNLTLNGRQGQKLWDTRNIGPGVYIYTLKTSGFSQSGKLVINK